MKHTITLYIPVDYSPPREARIVSFARKHFPDYTICAVRQGVAFYAESTDTHADIEWLEAQVRYSNKKLS